MEVDTSTTGVGAFLSQRQPPKLGPCAFFSKKLPPAEQNYDIVTGSFWQSNWLWRSEDTDWRVKHPFQVITDHRNLEYLQDARHLISSNPRQARFALLFT